MTDPRVLRDRVEKAIEKDRPKEVIELLLQLEKIEPDKARWPHRRGDMHRRLAQKKEAIAAYDRAVQLYNGEGFIAKAVALAKLIVDLDPTRVDVIDRFDPEAARRLRKPTRPPPAATAKPQIDFSATVPRLVSLPPEKRAPENQVAGPPKDWTESTSEIEIDIDISEVELAPRTPEIVTALSEGRSADELAALPAFPLLAETPNEALSDLVRGADLVELGHGHFVVRQGEPAEELYAIVEGGVRVLIPGMPADSIPFLGEGELFGESCLLENEPRKADVVVEQRLFALRIPRDVLKETVKKHPAVGDVLFALLTRRLIANLLQTSQIFSAFDPGTKLELSRMFEVRRSPPGVVLVTEGQRSPGLFIPLTGKLELTSSKTATMQILGPGGIVGQHSLFFQQASDLTAKTGVEMAVLCLPAESFAKVASQYPPVLAHLAELASTPSMPQAPAARTSGHWS
jgi:CRP-like cAMP-binding protein